jgi:hypothetical protein
VSATEYSHRDRRAEREVGRAFLALAGVTLALVVAALAIPFSFSGWLEVIALGILGIAYVGWSERFLQQYSDDRKAEREGESRSGFLRAEGRSPVRRDEELGRPSGRSPHARRRAMAAVGAESEPLAPPGFEPPQR